MLKAVPITLKVAKAFVNEHHRHHIAPVGWKFGIGATNGSDELVGVVVASRPVARRLDDGLTIEFTRVATNGTRNACSFLYAAAWNAAKAMGYLRGLTYTLESESGSSLKAVGWKQDIISPGGGWSRKSRPRDDKHPLEAKLRWTIGDWK